VVLLGGVERARGADLGGDLAGEPPRLVDRALRRFGEAPLLVVRDEDHAPVLRSFVAELAL
jgi:hypothetical protein